MRGRAGAAFSEAAATGFHFPCKLRLRLTSSKASKSKCRAEPVTKGKVVELLEEILATARPRRL